MLYTLFILPSSPLIPPNITALLSSTVVKVKPEHGGGLSPVVAGQLHTPVHTVRAIIIGHMLLIRTLKHIVTTITMTADTYTYVVGRFVWKSNLSDINFVYLLRDCRCETH